MKKRSIACIGQGFVGGSLTTVFSERGFDVYAYDKAGKYASEAKHAGQLYQGENDRLRGTRMHAKSVQEIVAFCEQERSFTGVYFVCLPTPMFEDGSADLSIVEGVLDQLAEIPGPFKDQNKRVAVVKSTVPPGSTETWNKKYEGMGLHVVFNPEFLVEKTALDDMRNQTRIILGGPRPHINVVKNVFQSAFPTVPIVKTSSTNAELTKYVTNCFLAMKISFANEISQLCEALDSKGLNADYDRVVECATLDPRLGTSHWRVPSFEVDDDGKPLRGFSLSCFPKDVNALIHKEKELGLKPTMLEATWEKNLEVRPQKDWEKMLGRAVSKNDKKE